LPADGEYLRLEDFLALDFFADEPRVLFFELLLRVLFLEPVLRVLFFALLREDRPELPRDELRFEVLDFFLAAFLVAMTILLGGQMARGLRQVACARRRKVASRWTRDCTRVTQCGGLPACVRGDRR
jgi:hypothetical protein